jgi:TonB family protein
MTPAWAGIEGGAGAMTAGPGSFRVPALPWAGAAADERLFRGILRGCLLAALVLALALPWLQLSALEKPTPQPLPAPITRLVLERNAPAAPAAIKPDSKLADKPDAHQARPRVESKPAADAAQALPAAAAAQRATAAAPALAPRLPVESPRQGELALDQARRRAAASGLLALKNEISALSAALPAIGLKPDVQAAPGLGTSSGPGAGAGKEAGEAARALVTASAGRNSGGIASAASNSRDSGGAGSGGGSPGGLAGRATTMLAGAGATTGAAGGEVQLAAAAPGKPAAAVAPRPSSRPVRSIEDIKLVFERQKGAIYALYNRALRDDPALQGKVVLELKIAPGGQVTELRIVSSELKSEDLERKLLARIRQFDFGAKDVDALVLTWPVDFLPS